MSRGKFEQGVDAFFAAHPCEDAISAKGALLTLYDFIARKAQEVTEFDEGSPPWAACFFKIQQTMCWTPLRLFLKTLAEDEALAIRAGAKGEICDRTAGQEYWNDPEVGLIGQANLALMLGGHTMSLQGDLDAEPALLEALRLWQISTQGLKFTPNLTVRVIEPPQPPER